MMAGRTAEKTCQVLLQRLQRGQDDLRRSLEQLQPRKQSQQRRSPRLLVTSLRHHHHHGGGSSPLCCVEHLPRRRARTDQLSPETHSHVSRKHRRRLSSTPKHSSPSTPPPPLFPRTPLTAHSPHSTDLSLEEALLSRGTTGGERKGEREGEGAAFKTRVERSKRKSSAKSGKQQKAKGAKQRDITETAVESSLRKSAKRSVKRSREKGEACSSSLHTSLSGVVDGSASIRSRYEIGRKKPRGLTVSFVTNENASPTSANQQQGGSGSSRYGLRKRKSKDLSFTEEKEKGERLVESLNSSRFGALEQHRESSVLRKTPRLGRQRWAGDDPKLGYDWIAGLVEVGSQLEGKDDCYFEEMKEFRRVNCSECSRPHPAFLPDSDDDSSTPSPAHPSLSTPHTRCTQSYVLNDRLFPVPRCAGSGREGCGESCPVCEGGTGKGHKEGGQPVRYIRVSVPRSSVQPAYHQLRPHRRRSFDPSDSMALHKHCLAGWQSAKPPSLPPQPSLDLRSALTDPPPSSTAPHTRHASRSTRDRSNTKSKTTESLSRDLMNTSHGVEYSLRFRGHGNV